MGLQWLQNILGEKYRVHPLENVYNGIHIDTTFVFLRPGLVMVNPERINDDNLPAFLKGWDRIEAPQMVEKIDNDGPTLASYWIGMNFLMVNPNLAVVEESQIHLIKQLEKHKIDVIALPLRHSRKLGGGFHCVTSDIRRKSKLEDYSS